MAKDSLRPLIEKGYVEKISDYSNWLTPIRLVQTSTENIDSA